MEKHEINGPVHPSSSGSNGRTVRSPAHQTNFNSRAVQEALEHLASVDLSELFNEAKTEYCRATRDLRRCGRYVKYVLNSCGHASICAECCQRCDLCPICRIPLTSGNNRLRLRLYDECIDGGLISRRYELRVYLNGKTTDVTDICMDETAVSSDAITALLLDEKVVKDWVKRKFKNITTELQQIYCLKVGEMEKSLGLLHKYSAYLASLSSILEVLESSFKGRPLAQLHVLHHLQESILKTKQHLEIIMWCIRHQFLEHVRSRHANFTSWHNLVRERKSAATARAWPDVVDRSADSTRQDGSLFIEDALANLDIEQAYDQELGEESYFAFLLKDSASFSRSKIEGLIGCYPFESLQAAVDILFLRGSSDSVVAKQAIFVYYLFDRHWSRPEEEWRDIVDDFATSFGINRHSLLESFIFCLLDNHTDEALQESFQLLPEISGPTTHPKIARVLLERQNPEAAYMVLRWSGRDDGSQLVSLSEAVTVVWVKVECRLLTEAFTYQRMLCTKVREKNFKYGPSEDGQCRNLVDRIIELPWNSDEEKYIHKCLLDCASDDPSSANGSLLVVFYLQVTDIHTACNRVTFRLGLYGRYRYVEAYQVSLKLWTLEEDFISTHSVNEEFLEVLSRMESCRQRRKALVDKGIELLPEVLQQQVKTGMLPDIVVTFGQENEMPARSGLPKLQEPEPAPLLVPSTSDSILLRPDLLTTPSRPAVSEIPKIFGGYVNDSHVGAGNHRSLSILHGRLFAGPETASNFEVCKSFNFEDISSPGIHRVSPTYATPLKGISQSSSRELPIRHLREKQSDKIISEGEQNGFVNQVHNTSPPYSRRVTANPVSMPSSNYSLKGSANSLRSNISGKRGQSNRDDSYWTVPPNEDLTDIISWR
ncbi:hypothetical protein GOBAR_DD36743 [Gossypium barbadense]|nr:hypothetical protein GOBAR_DD36743 [Gossypium barbadense]